MKARLGIAAVVAALIWAAVIIAVSITVRTDEFPRLLPILGGGAAATIIMLGGLAAQQKNKD